MAREARRNGPELLARKPAWDDGDPARVGVVERHEVTAVVGTFGDDRVGGVDDVALDRDALWGELVCGSLVQSAYESQAVKSHDERQAERALQLHGHEPRHEKMRVNDVVALPRREPLDERRELRDRWEDVLLAD